MEVVLVRVRASIHLLAENEGGRSASIPGGTSYRPNHNFFGPDNHDMCVGLIDVPLGPPFHPGETREITIDLWTWAELRSDINTGRTWSIQEGATLVGTGTVLEVLKD